MGRWPTKFTFSYLVEAIFTSVADIDNLDDFGGQSQIKDIALAQLGFEVGRTGKDEASHVDFVIGDEVLNSQLGYLPDIVVAFLVSKTRETQG